MPTGEEDEAEAVCWFCRLASRFCRKVCRSALWLPSVLLEDALELPPEAVLRADSRFLKSDCSVDRVLFELEDELLELLLELDESSWIRFCRPLVRLE